ncbi:MAG: hypothetical protein HY040_13400 [Planctomycetes bacterium]|nr:hypothetical protein [Planctomycetota bacterium]
MAKLGRCLVFYLKYPAEMNRLYWDPRETDENPDVSGLSDAENVLPMIKRVGDAACHEAAALLDECIGRIEPQLQSIGNARRGRDNLERTWSVQWRLSPKKQDARTFYVGLYIDEAKCALVPWVWCRGGRRVEDEVTKILGRGIQGRSFDSTMNAGFVALGLAKVELPAPPHEFDVEQEAVVAGVCENFSTLTAADVKAIARIAAKSSE